MSFWCVVVQTPQGLSPWTRHLMLEVTLACSHATQALSMAGSSVSESRPRILISFGELAWFEVALLVSTKSAKRLVLWSPATVLHRSTDLLTTFS